MFYKKDGAFGDNVTIIMENCISYKNGFLDENTIAPDGNGNGYKCGSDQGAMNVYLSRCLAICNKAKGFDQNHNAGDIIMNNCTGMTLTSIDSKSYSYRIYETIDQGHEVRLTNCIAINDNYATDKRDKNTGLPKPTEHGKNGQYGRFEVDETLDRLTVDHCEFQKADPTQFVDVDNHQELMAERGEDGELPETTFAHLTPGSFLVDAGTAVEGGNYRGIEVAGIDYVGQAPDLGAYESGITDAISHPADLQTDAQLQLRSTQGGLLIVSVHGPASSTPRRLCVYNTAGQLMSAHSFIGNTTAIPMPRNGAAIITVDGKSGKILNKK